MRWFWQLFIIAWAGFAIEYWGVPEHFAVTAAAIICVLMYQRDRLIADRDRIIADMSQRDRDRAIDRGDDRWEEFADRNPVSNVVCISDENIEEFARKQSGSRRP